MLSFYLKAVKCLKKKKKPIKKQLLNTKKFCLKNVELFSSLFLRHFCKCLSVYFHVTIVGLK